MPRPPEIHTSSRYSAPSKCSRWKTYLLTPLSPNRCSKSVQPRSEMVTKHATYLTPTQSKGILLLSELMLAVPLRFLRHERVPDSSKLTYRTGNGVGRDPSRPTPLSVHLTARDEESLCTLFQFRELRTKSLHRILDLALLSIIRVSASSNRPPSNHSSHQIIALRESTYFGKRSLTS
ncbi:hypothetical protein FRB94_004436 [Tulasnella sp. JGI-2019a]|nr:hypothetical protein FRB94_004436 [Tulasnella sp. JGI-2019a]KAG9029346.1 hypothetical protein FRB95_005462 [Tulasnella sp. JGI-2019a]